MIGYLIRRVLQSLLILFLVTVFTLALVHLFPGGPIRSLLGPRATPQQVAYYNQLYGFDQPFYVQYLKWVGQLLHGNLGYSAKLNQSVTSLIAQDLPKTIVLVVLGTCRLTRLRHPARHLPGREALHHRRLHPDRGLVPRVRHPDVLRRPAAGRMVRHRHPLFPPFGPQGSTVVQILSQPRALVLPVAAYSFVLYALWSRYMRSSVMDNLVQDYVRTARAKGASERRVLWGHVFRNSLMSIVTLLGLSLPTLVAGALFIEVVFNYPGMGLAFYNAALNVDYQVLLGFTLIATVVTIVGNLLADVGYAVLDPRVRY